MSIVVATSLYPAACRFLADWMAGVRDAAQGRTDVCAVIAVDGVADVEAQLAQVSALIGVHFDVHCVAASASSSIAQVRLSMIEAAVGKGADVVVFCDSDDALLPNALVVHLDALETHALSAADLAIAGPRLSAQGRLMLGPSLTATITRDALSHTNVMGFSNTAVRTDILSRFLADVDAIPEDIVAVDWWVFEVLLGQAGPARGTPLPVALYRQHNANTLGADATTDVTRARTKLDIYLRQMRLGLFHQDRGHLIRTGHRLLADPAALSRAMRLAVPASSAWFADVASWLDAAEDQEAA